MSGEVKPSVVPGSPGPTISMLAAKPPVGSWFSSLRFRLLLAILVPFLPAAGLVAYNAIDRRADDVRHAHDDLGRILTLAAAQGRQGLDHARQFLFTLSHQPCVRALDVPACNTLFAEFVAENPYYANIALVGPKGECLASGIPVKGAMETPNRVWFQRAVKTRRLAIGDYVVGRTTGRPSIHVAQPMLAPATEEVLAVLVVAIDLDHLARFLPADLPDGSAAYVLDSEGTILGQAGRTSGTGTGMLFPHRDLLYAPGVVESEGPDGFPRYFGSREIHIADDTPALRVALAMPSTAALAEADQMINRDLAALTILTLLALGMWLLGDRFLVRRTQALVRVTRDLGSGRLGARAPVPYDHGELGQLERAFNVMADSLQHRSAALGESEARFREIAETIQEVFWIVTPGLDRVMYVSPAAEKIWGLPGAAFIARPALFRETVYPEDRPRLEAALGAMGEDGLNEEYRIVLPNRTTRWVLSRAFPILESDGSVLRVIGVTEDLTERKRLEEQFLQSQKMDALGRLAGGVAHDFNNLLTIISGYGDLLISDPRFDSETRHQLGEIIGSAHRASALTRQLLAFSRKQLVERQPLILNEVVKRMHGLLGRLIGEDIRLVTSTAEDLGTVMADPGQIEQVMMNLVVNARDAMPRGGTIRLETANVDLDETYARDHADVKPGPHVMLAITDTGVGMDAATRARLFEPFFTTKEKGKGTGLGLSTVYGIVKQVGGHIWVYSEPARGSTFKIYFPRALDEEAAGAPQPVTEASRGGSETILVVEDEANLRELIRGALQSRGYAVIEAADGAQAQRVSDLFKGPIQLLMTDSVLPNLSGPALSRTLQDKRPELKVLFMSGYTDASVFEQAGVEVGKAFLQKPFTIDAMARKIREVLETP
ncbi:MAG TPA: ATP-binding protein [Planctomycetota bacterium]|nr:ATP-binding protein [Planctomycetota bacterium]